MGEWLFRIRQEDKVSNSTGKNSYRIPEVGCFQDHSLIHSLIKHFLAPSKCQALLSTLVTWRLLQTGCVYPSTLLIPSAVV